jgi:alkanesulfonate monooxygenase SsuD/methylene tetrahydromethanopterin reductase-like flavin-dependent oxidoreductase (luciferase family)
LTFLQDDERRFVTPEAIRATCLTGEPDEIIERIRELERAGIPEIALLSPADYQRKVYRDVAELVIPAFR